MLEYRVRAVYFIKMKVQTHSLYKEHCELYTKIHGSIAVNSCQIELAQKYIILLTNVSIIVYKAGKGTGVENNVFSHVNLSVGTYSVGDFNAKIKESILQKRQHWEAPQIKDLQLVIPEHYTCMSSNTIFTALGIHNNYLEKTALVRSILPSGSYKTSLDISRPPKSLSLHCKQINKVNGWATIKFVGLHARF